MSEIKNSPFALAQFHIDEFSITRSFVDQGKPEFEFDPQGFIDYEENNYVLTILFGARDSNNAYDIKCKCTGFFRFQVEEGEELNLNTNFYVNAPAIVFPYIRAYIASITALSGLSTVHIPTMNFPVKIGEKLKQNTISSREELPTAKKIKSVPKRISKTTKGNNVN